MCSLINSAYITANNCGQRTKNSTIPSKVIYITLLLIKIYAVQSSRIEGTQASLSDIFYYEASKEKPKHADVLEVLNYVKAMNYGLSRLKGLPLSLRLVRCLNIPKFQNCIA